MNDASSSPGRYAVETDRSRGWLLTVPVIVTRPVDPEDPSKGRRPTGRIRTEKDLAEALGTLPWCGQMEEGEERGDGQTHGYLHWQLWVETRNPIRFTALKRRLEKHGIPDAHIEARQGSKRQAFEYVTKERTRVAHVIDIDIP